MDGKENEQSETSAEAPPKSRGPWIAVLLLALVLIAGGAAFWWFALRGQGQTVAAVADAGTPVAAVDGGPSVSLAEGNALLKQSAKGLIPDDWLNAPDAIRRFAAAVYAVSEGESPRVMLTMMAPGGTFSVDEQRPPPPPKQKGKGKKQKHEPSKYFINEKNDARYDKVTQIVTAIDPAAAAKLYRSLKPYIEVAFKEIAPPGKTFDGAFNAAVERLGKVPISDGPREVLLMKEGVGYTWADPKLEALSPAEKHLLRMGPKNARAIVKQLEAFQAAAAKP
jgi:hypothetical protein